MNAAKVVNIFETTKYVVQNLIFVHEFMNTFYFLNMEIEQIFKNTLLYIYKK